MKIIGMGFTCLDYIDYLGEKYCSSGGTCTNVLAALSFLGLESHLCILQYEDEAFETYISDIKMKGVYSDFYGRSKKFFPRIFQFMKNGEHYYKTKCDYCNNSFVEIDIPKENKTIEISEYIKKADFFYCDRISKSIKYLVSEAKSHNIWTMYEPNNCRFYKQQLESMKMFDIIKFSTGRISENISEKLKVDLEESSVKLFIVTRGEKGIKYSIRDVNGRLSDWNYINANNQDNILDSSGAGDWVTAILIYSLLSDYKKSNAFFDVKNIRTYLDKAKDISALSCKYIGAQGLLYDQKAFEYISKILNIEISSKAYNKIDIDKDIRCPSCGKKLI